MAKPTKQELDMFAELGKVFEKETPSGKKVLQAIVEEKPVPKNLKKSDQELVSRVKDIAKSRKKEDAEAQQALYEEIEKVNRKKRRQARREARQAANQNVPLKEREKVLEKAAEPAEEPIKNLKDLPVEERVLALADAMESAAGVIFKEFGDDRSKPSPREPFAKEFAKDYVGKLPNEGRPANVAPSAPAGEEPLVTTAVGGITDDPLAAKGTIDFVTDDNGILQFDASVPEPVRQKYQDLYDFTSSITSLAQGGRAMPDRISSIFKNDASQKGLFENIRISPNGTLTVPQGLNPDLAKFAQEVQRRSRNSEFNRDAFPNVGESWEQYGKRFANEGGSWWMGPLGHLLPKDVRVGINEAAGNIGETVFGTAGGQAGDIQLLTPEQRELQNLAIAQAAAQLPQVGRPTPIPQAPTLNPPPPLPNLNFNYPGFSQPQQTAPGFTPLTGLLGPETDFGPIEERARRQFQTQTIPTLAERFTALGGQRGSGFQGVLGRAASDLESQLAGLRSQFSERARQQRFTEAQAQNAQQLQLQQLQNQLAQSQNAQQLQREELQNTLAARTNEQRLAAQAQAAQQGLSFGGLQQQQFAQGVPNLLESQRQAASGTLNLLQSALQPRTEPVVQTPTPGILQTAAQSFAQAAPALALRYATGGII